MGKTALIDEWYRTTRVPADRSGAAAEAVRRRRVGKAFSTRLRRGIRAVVRGTPGVASVRVSVSR